MTSTDLFFSSSLFPDIQSYSVGLFLGRQDINIICYQKVPSACYCCSPSWIEFCRTKVWFPFILQNLTKFQYNLKIILHVSNLNFSYNHSIFYYYDQSTKNIQEKHQCILINVHPLQIIFNPATFSCLSQTRPGFSILYLVVFLCSKFQDERWLFVSFYPFYEKKSTKSDDQHSSIIYKYLSPQTNSSTQKIP